MDNSDDSFRAAKKVIDLIQNGSKNITQETEDKKKMPEITAFHSIKHHGFPKSWPIRVPSAYGNSYTIPTVDFNKLEREYKEHGKKILDKTEKMFEKEKIPIETRLIDDKKPEDYISEIVQEENFDLVALGCKGEHSKLEEIFIGSIAHNALNNVDADLLIVR